MENQDKKTPPSENGDVEMGALINLFIRICRKIISFFAMIFSSIWAVILYILLFLKKNLIWLVVAVIIGLVWGIFNDYRHGSKYESSMVVRTNFGSSRALYNAVDYINAMIAERKLRELSEVLSISQTDALSLRYIKAEPVEDELALTDLYKQKFLAHDRSDLIRTDTFWTRVLKYDDFKKSLTKFDMPIHEITAVSIEPDVFGRLQPGIIHCIMRDDVFKKIEDTRMETQKDEEEIVLSSIQGLDTLRKVYNERLQHPAGRDAGSTNLNLLDKDLNIKTPELDLYDKLMELKDELKNIRNNSTENNATIRVYSSFNPVGKKMNVLKQDSADYTIKVVAMTLILLIIIEVYKAAGKYERNAKS